MPSIFSSSNRETTSVKYFEIRLDESNIILRGGENEAPSAILKGTLVLCLSEPLQIKGIRMRFTGERRLAWFQNSTNGTNQFKYEEEFLRHTWDFKKSTETLLAGNYEWPFDMLITGSTPESLEGLSDSWIIYRMKATIERGMLLQNSIARKQVRIIRSLDPTALELAHSMSVDNIWPAKLEYSLSTPMKAVIFGSYICVEFKLIPLLKGLKIGKVITELVEKHEFHIRTTKVAARSRTIVRNIHKDEYRLPDDAEAEDVEGQEGYVFTRSIPVPQNLKKCVQTIDVLGIKIRHSLTFNVQLQNPDGHVSELHATLPVYIFLSPNLPIDENNNLVNHGVGGAMTAESLSDLTPPQYGEHQFDQLYSDIDPSGYMTPIGAASNLDSPIQSRSRSVSSENLASMDAMTSRPFAANALQTRLNNLDITGAGAGPSRYARDRSSLSTSGDGTGPNDASNARRVDENSNFQNSPPSRGGYFAAREGSSAGQTPGDNLSRRVSEEDEESSESQTPQHLEYSAVDLAKVPSYTTALRSNPRTPMNDGLPSYQTATRSPASSPHVPRVPSQVHINFPIGSST